MERATFLTRVVLENYKSIAHCDVRLGPLNYLVGPNGAGKSNFLDALRFVADALTHSVQHALHSRGGGDAICHAPHKQQGYFRIHLDFITQDGASGHYTLKVGVTKGAASTPWEVQEEEIGLPPARVGEGGSAVTVNPHVNLLGGRLGLAFLADDLLYRGFYTSLTRMLFYNIHPRTIEDVVTFEPGQFLTPDGSNLASVFFRLGCPPNEVAERINEYLPLILPGLAKVRAETVLKSQPEFLLEGQKVALLFEQRLQDGGAHLFWPSQMSDGTLRALGILTALEQACVEEGPRPSLVAIEEPEAQVYPAVVGVLRDAMVEASYSTQVLVTTHSSELLDDKDVDVDSILAVTAEEGASLIAPINDAGRDLIRRRLYNPGELLRTGHLYPRKGGPNGSTAAHQPETSRVRP